MNAAQRVLPAHSLVRIPNSYASELLSAVRSLPSYENQEYYDLVLQRRIHQHVAENASEALGWLQDVIAASLGRYPYAVVVSGLEFDERNTLFVALNATFGDLVARPYEKPRAQLVHYVQPGTDLPSKISGVYETERMHTDTADWRHPVELISMQCVRADASGGGRSIIRALDDIREQVVTELGTKALATLEETRVCWPIPDYHGGGTMDRPILGQDHVCWRRYTIDSVNFSYDAAFVHLLDEFEALVNNNTLAIDFMLQDSDWLLLDNHKTLHARTPVQDPERLMIRSWVRQRSRERVQA